MENKIENMQVYVQRMRKSLLDKLFFMDKTYRPIKAIVDVGCANGVLIHAMQEFFPEYTYIGYDINKEMIAQARILNPSIAFYNDWDKLLSYMEKNGLNPAESLVSVSSVIHEVYSYEDKSGVEAFWGKVFGTGFHYIAVRDMMLPEAIIKTKTLAPAEAVKRARTTFSVQVESFEKEWGSITELRNFLHFALKYKYTENWRREVKENYFPIAAEEFLKIVEKHSYTAIYKEHSTPVYIRQSVMHGELQYDLANTPTHMKLLCERI